jgi:geranylgeranylglycerol-phosphate geranylgeranyltransferase
MFGFLKRYIKSMRLYYSFVTGIAGWIGVAYYESSVRAGEALLPGKKLVILTLAFLSWGVNQVINDYLGLKEDRINAPERPMVTGELNPQRAVLLSAFLILLSVFITWFYLEPVAVIFLVAGVVLNIVYETAKGHGVLGNIVFGFMISMATLYGFFASGAVDTLHVLQYILPVLILLWLINGLMTFYTYFKDYRGDRRAGKKTLVVLWGLKRSKTAAIASAFLPILAFFALKLANLFPSQINREFLLLGAAAVALQIWTGLLFYLRPVGRATYISLGVNFRACVCAEAALIALFDPSLALRLFVISYVAVSLLFLLHRNAKA